MNRPVGEKIDTLVKESRDQQSVLQYSYIAATVIKQSPCNFLVFGCGKDSQLWVDANTGGRTVFLEDSDEWIAKVKKDSPEYDFEIYKVEYGTKRAEYLELVDNYDRLKMNLPKEVSGYIWDIVLIDAPRGFKDEHPGRMQSIYMGSTLGKTILVHDCNRAVESMYSGLYCGTLVREVGCAPSLRHYEKR